MTGDRGRRAPRGAAFLTHLHTALATLPESQRRIGEFAVGAPLQAAQMTITELAEEIGTSPATVTRFCRAVGLRSYAQLRLELASAAEEGQTRARGELSGDIGQDDAMAVIIEKMTEAYTRMITETARFLDADDLERIAAAILAAGQVRVFGMGSGGAVARYLQGKLRSMGLSAIAFSDPREALIDLANADPSDVHVIISQSGEGEDAEQVLTTAIAGGLTTLALTADPGSAIAGRADHVLRAVVRADSFDTGAMSSRQVELWLIDCLCTAILVRRYDETTAALTRVKQALDGVRRAGK